MEFGNRTLMPKTWLSFRLAKHLDGVCFLYLILNRTLMFNSIKY